MRVLIRNEMFFMWVLDTLYSLLGNWLRDHTSWASSGIGVKIKSLPKNFWSLVLNFTAPRYAFLFSNSETLHMLSFSNEIDSFFFPLHTSIFPTTRTQIERMSSAKLDEVLSAQEPSSDKTGLGYAISSGPSSSTASGSRTVFVSQSEKGNKGMKSKTVLANYKSFVRPHLCHHCGVFGHIRPNCFKLYPQKQMSKWSQVSF